MRRLGVLDDGDGRGRPAKSLVCLPARGPGRRARPARGAAAQGLDWVLCPAAVAAGARMFAPLRFVAPLRVGDAAAATSSARSLQQGERVREVRARGWCWPPGRSRRRRWPPACRPPDAERMALRGYVRNAGDGRPADQPRGGLAPRLPPGDGWIFPCRGGVFNIGVGIATVSDRRRQAREAGREPARGRSRPSSGSTRPRASSSLAAHGCEPARN